MMVDETIQSVIQEKVGRKGRLNNISLLGVTLKNNPAK